MPVFLLLGPSHREALEPINKVGFFQALYIICIQLKIGNDLASFVSSFVKGLSISIITSIQQKTMVIFDSFQTFFILNTFKTSEFVQDIPSL